MSKTLLTQEQKKWVAKQLEIMAPYEVLSLLNKTFNLSLTADQFKRWRNRYGIYGKIRKCPFKNVSNIFTQEQVNFILEHYKEWESPIIAAKLNEKFKTNFTKKQVRTYRHNHGLFSELTGGYSDLRPNPLKGTHNFIKNSEKTRIKAGQPLVEPKPVGTIKWRASANCYWIKTAQPNTWESLNRYLWIKANGEIPEGMRLVYLDQNPLNCVLENLALIYTTETMILNNKKRLTNDQTATQAGILLTRLENKLKERAKE